MSLRSWAMRRRLEAIAAHAATSPWVQKTEVVALDDVNEQAHSLGVYKADGEREERIYVSVTRAGLWDVTRWTRADEYAPWLDEEPRTLPGFGGPLRVDADPRDVLAALELYFLQRP